MSAATRVVPLAILDGYKVKWNRDTVARDVVQNFFDEVQDFDDVKIAVDAKARTVRVSGPSEFALEYLQYVGATTKAAPSRRSAGGFGEGFKICALVCVRDFGVKLSAGSGRWRISPFLRDARLGRELCYAVEEVPEDARVAGSWVLLENADAALRRSFEGVRDRFRHPRHPSLQRPVHVDDAAGVGVWESPDQTAGAVFYRRQLRGRVHFPRGGALVFAYDDRLDALEEDRDRRDLRHALHVVRAVAARLPDEVLLRLVRHLRASWARGGAPLTAIVDEAARRGLRTTFPPRWVARERLAFAVERHAARRGAHLGVEKLARIGMPRVTERFGAAEVPRPPSAVEEARLRIARALYPRLAGHPPPTPTIGVVELGAVDRNAFHDRTVPAGLLASDFREAIADVLAAFAVGTYRQTATHADRLTSLLEGLLRDVDELGPWEERWRRAAEDPAGVADDLEALPAFAPERPSALEDRRTPVEVEILAPSGWPPAAALAQRLKEAFGDDDGGAYVTLTKVDCRRDALLHVVRSLPWIRLDGRDLFPARGAPSLRVAPCGPGPALLPDDALILDAVERARAAGDTLRSQLRRFEARRRDGAKRLVAWLRRHDPDGLRDELRRRAIDAAFEALQWSPSPWALRSIARELARRALEETPFDEATLVRAAARHLSDATGTATHLRGALVERWPVLAEDETGLLSHLVAAAAERLESDASWDETLQRALDAGPDAAALAGMLASLPLDDTCRGALGSVACRELERDARPGCAGRILPVLEAAAQFALARHDTRDEYGVPPECSELREALVAEKLMEPPPEPAPDPIARAVEAEHAAALAEGLDEPAALARCLETARRMTEERERRRASGERTAHAAP